MGFLRRVGTLGLGVSLCMPLSWAFAPAVFASYPTSGSSALKEDITPPDLAVQNAFASQPSTPSDASVVQFPGGAGNGLQTSGELAGAGISVSTAVADETSAGVLSLTPAGWAIAASLGVAAGGYFVYQNRRAIFKAVNSVWNNLSGTQQSDLLTNAQPGASGVQVPASAIRNILGSLSLPVPVSVSTSSSLGTLSAYASLTVPSGLSPGQQFQLNFRMGATNTSASTWETVAVSVPNSSESTTGQAPSFNWVYPYGGNGGGTYTHVGTQYASNWAAEYGNTAWYVNDIMSGVSPGSTIYFTGTYNLGTSQTNSVGLYDPTSGSVGTGLVSVSVAAIPNAGSASVPPVNIPDPSSANPSFIPGGSSHGQPEPIGHPASNPLVQPLPQGGFQPLPSGSPAPGFVTWLEQLVVPTANQIEQAVSPLTSAFADRIPFSYVTALIGLMPSWADGLASGGCAAFPIPEFGLNDNSNYHVQICQSSFIGSALSALKSAFSVLIWMFLLGWGVMMFRRLVR